MVKLPSMRYVFLGITAGVAVAVGLGSLSCFAATARRPDGEIFAQRLVNKTLAAHPVVTGLEISTSTKHGCATIASNDPKDMSEKCDKDELEPMRTGKPFVEHEKDGFDVTMPLRDASGKIIGSVGMDFKPAPNQTRSIVIRQASDIARELASQIPRKTSLFETVK